MNLIKYIGAVLMLALVSACGGGGGNPGASSGGSGASTPLFTSAPTSLTLASGTTSSSYSISGGVAPYTVNPDTPSLLSVSYADSAFTIKAAVGNGGNGAVIVLDSIGTKVTVAVTVPAPAALQSTAPSSLSLVMGSSNSYVISGGVGPYTATSANPALLSASVNSAALTISALAATAGGQASIVVTDAKGTLLTITVTVPAPAALQSTAPSSLSLVMGSSNSYVISGGVGPYTATSANPSLVSASANSASLIITALAATAGGQANVVVTDAKGTLLTITVTVPAPTALQSTAPSSLSLVMGSSNSYVISGGVGPYIATSANPSLVSASANSASLIITALAATTGGQANVVVTDAKGAQLTISVTVPAPAALQSTAPSSLSLVMGSSSSYVISGGVSPYTATSANPALLSASVNSAALSISALAGTAGGQANVVVTDAKGAQLTILVTVPAPVALSTTAPAVLTMPMPTSSNPSLTFTILGGTPNYTVVSTNPDVVSVVAPAAGGTAYTLTSKAGGSATILISDSKGATVSVSANVITLFRMNTPPLGVTIGIGAPGNTYTVTGGVRPYTAASADTSVVTISTPAADGTFVIQGVSGGNAGVYVYDATGQFQFVQVTVSSKLFTDASAFTTLSIGTTNFITVFGGVPFAAPASAYVVNVSNPEVVRVVLSGARLSVTGLAKGSATVGISDSKGTVTTLQFTVAAPSAVYTDAPALLSIAKGTGNTYTVLGGIPVSTAGANYNLNNSDPAVVSAVMTGSTLTIGGLSSGTATLVISDSAGVSTTISVTVTAQGLLRTSAPGSLTLAADGLPNTYGIAGGDGPYKVQSDNQLLVTAATSGVNGETLTITARTGTDGGMAKVIVTDAKGMQVTIQVTVPAPAVLSTTAPSPLAMPMPTSNNPSLTFAIFGGAPNYTVVSTNPDVVSVVAPAAGGTAYTLTSKAGGSATILISDSKGKTVTFLVTVPSNVLSLHIPTGTTIGIGAPGTPYQVSGGVPPYTSVSADTSILTASTPAADGSFVLQGIREGVSIVRIYDATGAWVFEQVTVSSKLFADASALTTLSIGTTNFITVFGGVPFAAPASAYVVNVSNPEVVRVVLSGNRLSVIGLTKGTATVGISDSKGTITTLQFDVPAPSAVYTDAPSLLSVASGTGNTYTVFGGTQLTGGSANYKLNNSDPSVVSANLTGSTLTIGGLSSGSATLVISDSAGASTTISVTVTAQGALRTSAPASLTLAADGLPNTYGVAGGDGPYTALSDNQLLATAATSGTNGETLTITAKTGTDGGVVHVIVTDAKGKQVTIQVTVPAPVGLFTTAPQQLAIAGGAPKIFAVFGGSPPYSVVSTNPAVVAGSISGSALTITGSMVGSGTIVVSDAKGTTVPITVAVNAAGPLFLTAPGANVVVTTSATYDIIGGVPPYLSSSTDLTVAQATIVNANQVRVNAMGTGGATIAVTDSAGTKVSVGVTVPGPSPLLMYTTAPTTGVFLASTDPAVTYQIYGGRPGYTVTSSNANIVQASLTAPGSNRFTLQAISGGKAEVLVQDSGGLPVTVQVTVGSANAFFVAAPAILNMGAGSTTLAPYRVSGGAKPYSVSTSDFRVATAFVDPVTSLLTVTALAVGSATLKVADAIGNNPYTITVVVDNASGGASNGTASIDILASSNTLNSTPGSSVGFVVTVKNGANAAMPNQTVVFTASSGTLTGANPAPVTNAAGTIATVSLSPGADASNRSITVTATTGGISKNIVIPVVGTTVSVSGPGSVLVGSAPQNFTLKAVDSSGKPVVGAVLTVASSLGNGLSSQTVTTDISGAATVAFTAINAGIGTDTLTVSGQGTSSTAAVVVSNVDFAFTAPAPAALLPVTSSNMVTVRYRVAGAGVNGQTVNFATTRGTLYSDALLTTPATTAVTAGAGLAAGVATIYVKSDTAGPVTVSAQLGTARSSLTAAFVATVPATLVLQANPAALLPNAGGSTTNQSALSAVVRDAIGNPVQGIVVNFNAIADASGGSISPGSVTTDAGGTATAQFIAGPSSTAANGVQIRATTPAFPAIFGDATLTVNGSALFISIARSSTLAVFDSTTYQKDFSVYVTDAAGAPAGNRTVTLSVWPTTYGKGVLVYPLPSGPWKYDVTALPPTAAGACANEDQNLNGTIDPTLLAPFTEDKNGNGRLDPGNPTVITASVTTDALGFGTFTLRFGKNYAWWVTARITAKSLVSGTESSQSQDYVLEMTAADAASPSTPANAISPFGYLPAAAPSCLNPG